MNSGRNRLGTFNRGAPLSVLVSTSSSAFSKARSTFGDMRGSKWMCLIDFLPIATSVPGTHLGENLHRLVGILAGEMRGLRKACRDALDHRRLRLDRRPVRDRDHHIGHVLAAADHFI